MVLRGKEQADKTIGADAPYSDGFDGKVFETVPIKQYAAFMG